MDSGSETRIRFGDVELTRPEPGRVIARVVLRWHEDEQFVGTAEGRDTDLGVLQCAAEATANGLGHAVGKRVRLDVVGTKTVEAFESVLVVVALSSRLDEHEQKLVGSSVIKGNGPEAAARAVLSATNRLLGSNLIYLRW
jgi:hypothetical protein